MCQWISIACAFAFVSCSAAAPLRGHGTPVREVDEQFRALAELPVWPGFDARATPLAVWDGEQSWIFAPGRMRVSAGRLPAIAANSSALIDGEPTATLLLDAQAPARRQAAVALHEAFHVFERARHPGWSANE